MNGLKKKQVIFLFRTNFSFLMLFIILFIGSFGPVYAEDFTIDRIWTSDLDGNGKGVFLPGASIRYNVDITLDKERIIIIWGTVTGTKEPTILSVKEEWHTLLIKILNGSSGQNTVSWDKTIPQEAKIDTEAIIEINVATNVATIEKVEKGNNTFFIGEVTDSVPLDLQQQAIEKVESLVDDIKKVAPNLDE